MNYFSSEFKLGILGGGQLGKMLLNETRKFDIQTYVLDPSAEAPCKIACNSFSQGDLMDFDTVYNFGKQVDVLTFEIENVNVDALEKLELEGIKVYPSSKNLRIIQNKATQKLFYLDNNLPTSAFSRFAYASEIEDAISNGGLKFPFVWKSAQFGYDGTGVKIVRTLQDLQGLPKGELVPDQVTIDMLNTEVEKNAGAKGFIFDGFPRTSAQAKALDVLMADKDSQIDAMIALEVEDEVLVKRLLGRGKTSGRPDDADEGIIRNRIKEYYKKTAVLKDFYTDQNKYFGVDGIGSIEDITERLSKVIDKL